jgi:hypothetical protein
METAAYICSHVFENTHPILLVSRDGGDWQCLCGGEHDIHEIPYVVGLNHLIERDPTLAELMDLPINWEAERGRVGEKWLRTRISHGR